MQRAIRIVLLSVVIIAVINPTFSWCENIRNVSGMSDVVVSDKTDTAYFYLSTQAEDIVYSNGNFISSSSNYDFQSEKFIKVDSQLKHAEFIDSSKYSEEVEAYRNTAKTKHEVTGVAYEDIKFSVKGNDLQIGALYLKGVKPANSVDVNYVVEKVFKIRANLKEDYYYIKIGDNIPHVNNYSVNKLAKVIDGELKETITVYENLEYLNNGAWRSSFSVHDNEYMHIHEFGKKTIHSDDYVLEALRKTKVINTKNRYEIKCIGHENRKVIFALNENVKGKGQVPDVRFIELNESNTIKMRSEKFRSTTVEGKLWYFKNQIYGLSQDNQVLSNLTTKKKIMVNGKSALGAFTKTNQTHSKYKLPIYEYRAKQYVCIEDLTALGYELEWDSKNRIGNWKYSGKSKMQTHKFKSTEIYDNDVFARIDGTLVHIYNAEGYSIVCVDDLNALGLKS